MRRMGIRSFLLFTLVGFVTSSLVWQHTASAEILLTSKSAMEDLSAQWEVDEKIERAHTKLESEKQALVLDEKVFQQNEKLFKKNAVSKEDYLLHKTKRDQTLVQIQETVASIRQLDILSKLLGQRSKISAGGKVSDKDYAKIFVELWKSKFDVATITYERLTLDAAYLSWVLTMYRKLHVKGATTLSDLWAIERKVIKVNEEASYQKSRIPATECVWKEYQKMVDSDGRFDPELPAKSPCRSNRRLTLSE